MRQIKNGEKYTAMRNGHKFSGVAGYDDGLLIFFTNSQSVGAYSVDPHPKGYTKGLYYEELGITNVMSGTSKIYLPVINSYSIRVEKDKLIFGCGEVEVTKQQIKNWVKARNSGKNTPEGKEIETALINNNVKLTEEEAERIDYLVNGKTGNFTKQLLYAANPGALPVFKHGDGFSLEIDGNTLTGRVSVANNTVVFCHNNEAYDDTTPSETFDYRYFITYKEWNGDCGMTNIKIMPLSEIEEPEATIEIGWDEYPIKPEGKNIVFGCGDVVLSKSQILNWLDVYSSNTQQIKDFRMIEEELRQRDSSFEDLNPKDLDKLKAMCKK